MFSTCPLFALCVIALTVSSLTLTTDGLEHDTCPAIDYKKDFTCSSNECIVSFLNLSPDPIDAVNVHFTSRTTIAKSADGATLVGQSQVSFRHPMTFASGMMTKQQERLSQALGLPSTGVSSAFAESLLQKNRAGQIFQVVVPSHLSQGQEVSLSFTYVAPGGLVCSTEVFPLVQPHIPTKPVTVYPPIAHSDMEDTDISSLQSNVDHFDSIIPTSSLSDLVTCPTDCLKRCRVYRRKEQCVHGCEADRQIACRKGYYGRDPSYDRLAESIDRDLLDETNHWN